MRIERSRAAMREALLDLLGEMPLEAVTGARVAAKAQVGYATYFRHYQNVRDLLVDTVVHLADDLSARMLAAIAGADTAGAAKVLIETVERRRGAFLALLTGAGDETRGMLTRHIIDRTAALPDLSPAWLPARLALRFAVASTVELLDWWLRDEPERSAEEVAALLDRLIIAPLRAG